MHKLLLFGLAGVMAFSLTACAKQPVAQDADSVSSQSIDEILDQMEDDAEAIENAQSQIQDKIQGGGAVVD